MRFVTQDCANNVFYADGPKCNEIDGKCPREKYRIEIEADDNIGEKEFRAYIARLFGSSVFPAQ